MRIKTAVLAGLSITLAVNLSSCRTSEKSSSKAFGAACNFLYPFLFNLPMGTESILPAIAIKAAAVGSAFLVQDANGCFGDSVASVSQKSLNEIAAIVHDETGKVIDDKEVSDLSALFSQVNAYRPDPISSYAPTSPVPGYITQAAQLTKEFRDKVPFTPFVLQYVSADAIQLKLYQERVRIYLETGRYAKDHGDSQSPYIDNAKSLARVILTMIQASTNVLDTMEKTDIPNSVKSWFVFNKTLQNGKKCFGYADDISLGIDLDHPKDCNWSVCYDVKNTEADIAEAANGSSPASTQLRQQFAKSSICKLSNVHNAPQLSADDTDKAQLDSFLMKTVYAKLGSQVSKEINARTEMVAYRKALYAIKQLMTAIIALPNDQFYTSAAADIEIFKAQPNLDSITLPDPPPPACGNAKAQYATVLGRASIWPNPGKQGNKVDLELTDLIDTIGVGVYPGFSRIASADVSCVAPGFKLQFKHYDAASKSYRSFDVLAPGGEEDLASAYPQVGDIGFVAVVAQ